MDKKKAKIFSNVIVLVSVLFLAFYLVKDEKIVWLPVERPFQFILSIGFVITGFIIESFSLIYFLKKEKFNLSLNKGIIATGKFILAKYIPGKFGVIVGKSAYITGITGSSTIKTFQLVFIFQILVLISAFLISIIPLYTFISNQSGYLVITIAIVLFLMFFLGNKAVLSRLSRLFKKITGIEVPVDFSMYRKNVFTTLFLLCLCFISFTIGFYFLSISLGIEISMTAAFLFPMAAFAGVLAIIAPGGIGVREGIITAGLLYYGLPQETAISLSAFSRIWFLIGEGLIFMVAISLNYYLAKYK